MKLLILLFAILLSACSAQNKCVRVAYYDYGNEGCIQHIYQFEGKYYPGAIGNNRGMEQHPVLGFNYRISELHAAVGLAQTRKVPQIRETNRRNKKILTDMLAQTEGISFSKLMDPAGDSATFLNLLLPDQETAQRTVDELNKAGVGGFNYWYTNMYHFVNQWDHLKNMQTASKLPAQVLGMPQDYTNLQLPKSQEGIGRLISFGIRCTWTDEEMKTLANNISNAVKKASLVPAM